MSLLAVIAAEEGHELAPMIMDPIWFPVIAAAFFVVVGLVTFSFRDVAHRHLRQSTNAGPGAGTHD